MRVVVDDQLAILAGLGGLEGLGPDDRLVCTFGFQSRIAAAALGDRATEGVLARLMRGVPAAQREALVLPGQHVRFSDPREVVLEVAYLKRALGCNSLTAEVIAVARAEGLAVRVSPGNGYGTFVDHLHGAEVEWEVWPV